MLEAHARAGIRNRLLHKIGLEDWDLIGPHLEAVTLKDRQVIEVYLGRDSAKGHA